MTIEEQMTEREVRQGYIRDLISELSVKEYPNIDRYIHEVKDIYSNGFRHSYSDITALLIRLDRENENAISNICQNLYSILAELADPQYKEVYKNLNKLYDHIALEQIRLREVYKDSKELVKRTKEMSNDATKLLEETKGIKQEVITILGIFAAIILAFTGGMAFSTSVLANIHLSSIYRIITAILLIGFVVFNILYALFYFIGIMVGKPVGQKKYLLILTDAVICILLAATILSWCFGLVEKRNDKIMKDIQVTDQMNWEQLEDEHIDSEK